MSIALGKNKQHSTLRAGGDDLAAGAMGRSVARKRAIEEVNKAEDEEAESELLRTMEVVKAEPKENIFYPPDVESLGRNLVDTLGLTEEEWDVLQACLAQPKPERKETVKERWLRIEELNKRMNEEREAQDKADLEEIGPDYQAWAASKFRDDWNAIWSRSYGSFEDTTRIPAMRFTYYNKPALDLDVSTRDTLQVFSAKVASTSGGLQWPLDVFGFIAIRDIIDHNRNIIFNCTRESCQTLTEEDHNLVLVGPTRAVFVSSPHPVTIEVDLKVKGTTESEDKDLSFLAVSFLCLSTRSRLFRCSYTSKLSTLEFTLGHLDSSVEATIFVRVIRGSWLDGFHCEFSAFSVRPKNIDHDENAADIDREKIVLFDSRGEKGIVDNDGNIMLSRRVVSVEICGELKVSFKAGKVDNDAMEKEEVFTPSRAGLSYREIDIGFCAMEVSVAWSLISGCPVTARTVL